LSASARRSCSGGPGRRSIPLLLEQASTRQGCADSASSRAASAGSGHRAAETLVAVLHLVAEKQLGILSTPGASPLAGAGQRRLCRADGLWIEVGIWERLPLRSSVIDAWKYARLMKARRLPDCPGRAGQQPAACLRLCLGGPP
jgi:hypothetical protein